MKSKIIKLKCIIIKIEVFHSFFTFYDNIIKIFILYRSNNIKNE